MAVNSFTGEQGNAESGIAVFYALSLMGLSYCIGCRSPAWKDRSKLTSVMGSALAVYWASMISLLVNYVLLFAVGVDKDARMCKNALYASCASYAIAKVAMGTFYIERVLIAYPLKAQMKRLLYWGPAVTVWLVGVCCIVITLHFGLHMIDEVGACRIGQPKIILVVVILCDVGADLGLAAAFVYPIFAASFRDARPLAIQSAVGSFVTCSASIGNYLYGWFTLGRLPAWAFITSVSISTVVNCIVVHLLTRHSRSRAGPHQSEQLRTASNPTIRGTETTSGTRSGKETSSLSDFLSGHTDTRLETFEECLYDDPCIAKMTGLV